MRSCIGIGVSQPFRLHIGLLVLNLVPLVWCRFFIELYLNGLKVAAPVEVMDLQTIVLYMVSHSEN